MLTKFIPTIFSKLGLLGSFISKITEFIEKINPKMCEIEAKANGREIKIKAPNPEEAERLMQLGKKYTG